MVPCFFLLACRRLTGTGSLPASAVLLRGIHSTTESSSVADTVGGSASQLASQRKKPDRPQHKSGSLAAGGDWTRHSNHHFALRPSYLSPLQAAYQSECDREERRQLVTSLLAAHKMLAEDIDGYDAAQIQRTARHRITHIRELSKDLNQLGPRSNVARCTARSQAFGFYALLEENAGARDADAQAFYEVRSLQMFGVDVCHA
jgi:hypothetical protein